MGLVVPGAAWSWPRVVWWGSLCAGREDAEVGRKRGAVVCVAVNDGEDFVVFVNGELVMATDSTPDQVADRLAGVLDSDLILFDLDAGDLPENWQWEDLAAYVRKNWGRILAEGRPGPEDVVMQVGGAG